MPAFLIFIRMFNKALLALLITFFSVNARAQFPRSSVFTKADTLRGSLSPLRNCYDINYYHLDIKFDIDNKYISGSNTFRFTATTNIDTLQFDLFQNLKINKIMYHGVSLSYLRAYNAVFISFPKGIRKGVKEEFTVFYEGSPPQAKKAPMESGIVYATDSLGYPMVATACESKGASIWWPNKDHLSDEVDSMLISITVPSTLKEVSNGRLRKVTKLNGGFTRYDWFVASPINNYNVAVNIGNYTLIQDKFAGEAGPLTLDYWVLPYNVTRAKNNLSNNVKAMLRSYEYWFGKYPFYKDGYKLVETPYPAMEHQSAISYGGYMKGGPKNELQDPLSKKLWDFVIIHESAHEWFGNSITAKDMADLWIHEAFASYAESLFIESQSGKKAGQQYLLNSRRGIANDRLIVAAYNVNQMGSGDMYSKGAALLNMARTVINDDAKWRNILRGLNKRFNYQTVSYNDVVDYITAQAGYNLKPVFNQYLLHKELPVLEFKTIAGRLQARWSAAEPGFNLPVNIEFQGTLKTIYPGGEYRVINIKGLTEKNIIIDRSDYYFKLGGE
jgi:aminopeptidase N